jgi:hypothetical protein
MLSVRADYIIFSVRHSYAPLTRDICLSRKEVELTLGRNRRIAHDYAFTVFLGEDSPAPIDKCAYFLLRAVEQREMHPQPC